MILFVQTPFCDMYNEETYEKVLMLYDSYNIDYKVGYKFKVQVLEQEIVVDELKAIELFNLWPLLDVSFCVKGLQMSLTINGTLTKEFYDRAN